MGQLKRVLETIQTQFGRLSPTHKLLIGSLAVLMAMSLFLVHQYTSEPAMVPLLPGASSEDQAAAAQFVKSRGHRHRIAPDGQVLVSPGAEFLLLAEMADYGSLPHDTTSVFDAMIEKQSWQRTSQQNDQIEVVTVQKGLEEIIARMPGVKSARVILDIPRQRSFGEPRQAPTAAATVFTDSGIDQKFADTIANLVAGSRAGLTVDRVRVIDGATNRHFRASDDDDIAATNYLEMTLAMERKKQTQIYDMLAPYIPGVIVTVHVQADNTRRTRQGRTVRPEGKGTENLLTMEEGYSREDIDAPRGGEPGLRSNTAEDITTGGGEAVTKSTESRSTTEFTPSFGFEEEQTVDARGYPTKINAVVNVPRSYFVRIWQNQQAAGAAAGGDPNAPAEPSDPELQTLVDAETKRIADEVRLQIDTSTVEGAEQGEVRVSMIPEVLGPGIDVTSAGGGFLGAIAGGEMTVGGLVRTVGLGLLALVSLGLMVLTAVKANKRDELPSAEDLVGLPPALRDDMDLVGEAMEADGVMSAVELSDDEMRVRRMQEQVGQLIESDPNGAAKLVGRWIREVD
ncbi:MAG: hypothetical protein RIB58_04660 [Phycisphaerales bacterium]